MSLIFVNPLLVAEILRSRKKIKTKEHEETPGSLIFLSTSGIITTAVPGWR